MPTTEQSHLLPTEQSHLLPTKQSHLLPTTDKNANREKTCKNKLHLLHSVFTLLLLGASAFLLEHIIRTSTSTRDLEYRSNQISYQMTDMESKMLELKKQYLEAVDVQRSVVRIYVNMQEIQRNITLTAKTYPDFKQYNEQIQPILQKLSSAQESQLSLLHDHFVACRCL